jgi:DNA (cytosine-5)-methyltransferase 1
MNYYNEFDPYAAQWLRNLIDAGHLPKGEVDSRSIKDVKASELTGYTQCHFFAGLGGWSHALRLAGWPEDRPVWTGSCPCQPFSAAGKGAGAADERHLWPVWFNLIRECRPDVIFGEQVEAAINHGWLDLVQADLEGEGYACGAVGLPAGGVGAPHIRQRLWFVADQLGVATRNRSEMRGALHGKLRGERFAEGRKPSSLADTQHTERGAERQIDTDAHGRDGLGRGGDVDQLGNNNNKGSQGHGQSGEQHDAEGRQGAQRHNPTPSFWINCDWLPCRDGKARPVEPGTFPLAHGVSGRVGRLRAYGNAIVPQVAQTFIEAYLES